MFEELPSKGIVVCLLSKGSPQSSNLINLENHTGTLRIQNRSNNQNTQKKMGKCSCPPLCQAGNRSCFSFWLTGVGLEGSVNTSGISEVIALQIDPRSVHNSASIRD